MSLTSTTPAPKTIALGGVATGRRKAKDEATCRDKMSFTQLYTFFKKGVDFCYCNRKYCIKAKFVNIKISYRDGKHEQQRVDVERTSEFSDDGSEDGGDHLKFINYVRLCLTCITIYQRLVITITYIKLSYRIGADIGESNSNDDTDGHCDEFVQASEGREKVTDRLG